MTARIFIGWDSRETIAYHVLAHSIIDRASIPVAISPVGNAVLPHALWWREKGPYDSTEFSNARFLVPALCDFKGWAIFMDCDMLCLDDIEELWNQRDERFAVMVRKHEHVPTNSTKFLGAIQTRYPRKNWSSLMLLNCSHPDTRTLTVKHVNHAAGLDLHGFSWTTEANIGTIVGSWNELVTHDRRAVSPSPSLVHYTDGGPWHGYLAQAAVDEWVQELDSLLGGSGNPVADIGYRLRSGVAEDAIEVTARYRRQR
jgi:lipopolysaccharide biosynthesis glycosyltransferase